MVANEFGSENPMDSKPRLLLVEDDAELARMTVSFLIEEGFDVEWVDDGKRAIAVILENCPDLVILDIMLPGADGIEVCHRVKPDYPNPILMLTAKDDDMVEVTSLNRGADGYLTKPVRPHVLLAHVRALLRRTPPPAQLQSADRIVVQDLVVDQTALRVTQNGTELLFTTAEFQLLLLLASKAGEIVSREAIFHAMRGIEYDGSDRSIDMRISTLRKKMTDERPPYRYIKTVRGKGYLLARS